MKIKVNDILPSPFQTREKINAGELVESIKQYGLIVPLRVRPKDGKYELVYGDRRLKALKEAGMQEVEVHVSDASDEDAQVMSLIENIQREDLQPIELAKALMALKNATSWSNREIANRGILSEKYLERIMALLREPQEVQEMISRSGHIPTSGGEPITEIHVREVRTARLEPKEHVQVLKKAAEEKLTSEQARTVAEAVKTARTPELKRKILTTPVVPEQEEIVTTAKREILLEQFAHVQKEIPTLEEFLFRRLRPLGKAIDQMGSLAADGILQESLSDQQRGAIIAYLTLAMDKIQRTLDELRRYTDGTQKEQRQFRLPSS